MPSLTREDIGPNTELHARILAEVRRRVRFSIRKLQDRRKQWRDAENEMIAYVPESMADSRRRESRELRGIPTYTTIKIPHSYGVAMSYWTYLASVFLSRTPVFQFDASGGEAQQQVLMLEALQAYQVRAGKQMVPLFCWLYDAVRLGCGVINTYWVQDTRHVTQIEHQINPLTGEIGRVQTTLELPGYVGNEVLNIHPRDFLPDPRFALKSFQRGEFCGVRTKLSWLDIKQREQQGYYVNVDTIQPTIPARFLDEDQDDSQVQRPDEDELDGGFRSSHMGSRRTPDVVPIYEMCIELIPSEWKLGKSDFPEKWVFTVTGDWTVVLGAQPHGAYHCKYPYSILELEPDAYALSTRGIPELLKGVQSTMDWLLNTHMYNVRASLNNLFVVDPSRVVMKDLTNPTPGGLIRLRPGGAGTLENVIKQLPITDVTNANLGNFQSMVTIGERVTGVSDGMMGAMTGTGRKTATEVRTSSYSGVSREKIVAEFCSALGWEDLAMQQVANAQQYYDEERTVRIVTNLADMAGVRSLKVTPQDIAGAYDFIPVDGTLPIDRFAQANLWKELLLGFKQLPQLGMQFDIGRIFAWVAQLSGLRNIDQFRLEMVPDAQMQAQAQAGNMVPLSGANSDPNLLTQPTGGIGPLPVGGGGLQ